MANNCSICVGTVGTGAWYSPDGGETWQRVTKGFWGESRVFGLAVHPKEPQVVYAGADDGIYRSRDKGASFERLDSPMNVLHVWKIAFDPMNPDIIFAGTHPAALFCSRDGGQHWEQLSVEMAEECANVRIPRVTALTVDPSDHHVVWAGVEVDGVRRSLDGGKTWTRIAGGLNDVGDDAPGPQKGQVGLNHMAWMMESLEDLKELYQRLIAKKIPIERVSDHGISIGIYFRDPDGNGVEVSYELPRSQWYRQEKIFLSDDRPRGCFPGPWDEHLVEAQTVSR